MGGALEELILRRGDRRQSGGRGCVDLTSSWGYCIIWIGGCHFLKQFVYCSKVDSAVYGVGVQRWVMMNYVVWLNWALTTCLLLLGISQRPSHLLDTAMVPIFVFHMRKLRLKPLDTGYTGYTESNCEVCGCSLKPSPTGSQDCLAASSAVWSYALSGLWWDFWLPRFVDKKNGVQNVLKHCASNL